MMISTVLIFSFIGFQSDSNLKDADLRCGAFCLYIALKASDAIAISFEEFESELGSPTRLGYSMERLSEVARAHGVQTLGVETTLNQLQSRTRPFICIALLEGTGHFLCVYDVDEKNVYVIDPPTERTIPRSTFDALWKGKVLLISKTALRPLDAGRSLKRMLSPLIIGVFFLFLTVFLFLAVRYRSKVRTG